MTAADGLAVSKPRRRRIVADLIRSGTMVSQEELVERLAAGGLKITQATVSRDLAELGAVKVRRGGAVAYALPGDLGAAELSEARLRRLFADWVESLEVAGTLVVIKTPPGSADVVGAALDGAGRPEIAGCIAGDDTVMVAVRDGFAARDLLTWLQGLTAN